MARITVNGTNLKYINTQIDGLKNLCSIREESGNNPSLVGTDKWPNVYLVVMITFIEIISVINWINL